MPVRKDTETQTSESDRLGPKAGISVSTIKVMDDESEHNQSHENNEHDNGASSNGTDVDGIKKPETTRRSKESTEINDTKELSGDEENQRQSGEDTTSSSVSRPTALPEPLSIKTGEEMNEDGSSVDAAGDNGEEEGRSHPPLQRSKSQLSPPVDATDAHPLLGGVEDEDQRPLYNLYAVVVSISIIFFL